MGLAMETICTFFVNYEQYIILLTICFFAGVAWRHHRLISRLFIIAASCLWVIYVYRYQIAVGWPALDASGELSLRELFSDGAFIRHWSSPSLPSPLLAPPRSFRPQLPPVVVAVGVVVEWVITATAMVTVTGEAASAAASW